MMASVCKQKVKSKTEACRIICFPFFASTPAMRLHEQYRLLQQHYGEQPVSPDVAELAALLACSPRNVRLQLAKMQQQGWLAWQPGRGRGHRSVLQCLQPPQDLQWQDRKSTRLN